MQMAPLCPVLHQSAKEAWWTASGGEPSAAFFNDLACLTACTGPMRRCRRQAAGQTCTCAVTATAALARCRFDQGGQWVGPSQTRFLAMAEEYGVRKYESTHSELLQQHVEAIRRPGSQLRAKPASCVPKQPAERQFGWLPPGLILLTTWTCSWRQHLCCRGNARGHACAAVRSPHSFACSSAAIAAPCCPALQSRGCPRCT